MKGFQHSNLPKTHRILSGDVITRQELKICYSCQKGFCRNKGRTKSVPVANRPGRFVCQRCANAILSGKLNPKLELIDANPR